MTRTRDMMLTEPGAITRRMFRDLDPWPETRGLIPAGEAKTPYKAPVEGEPDTKNVKVA